MKYCKECESKAQQEKAQHNKRYDKNVRRNKEVYHDKRWTKLTEECKRRFKGLDIYQYYINNATVYGSLSHHIEDVETCESRIYDLENLIYVSDMSHREIHNAYNKSEAKKKEMQKVLFSLLEKFKNEFGNEME